MFYVLLKNVLKDNYTPYKILQQALKLPAMKGYFKEINGGHRGITGKSIIDFLFGRRWSSLVCGKSIAGKKSWIKAMQNKHTETER